MVPLALAPSAVAVAVPEAADRLGSSIHHGPLFVEAEDSPHSTGGALKDDEHDHERAGTGRDPAGDAPSGNREHGHGDEHVATSGNGTPGRK
jgi:hypothetical protein